MKKSQRCLVVGLTSLSLGLVAPTVLSSVQPSVVMAEETQTTLDRAAIESGNYSSLAGTWRNQKGDVVTFNADGSGSSSHANGMTDTFTLGTSTTGDSTGQTYSSNYKSNTSTYGGSVVMYIPAGVDYGEVSSGGVTDDSDKSKDRIFIGQGIGPDFTTEVYYRDGGTTEKEPKKSQSTSKTSSTSDSSFNRAEIESGKYQSIAGTWKNGKNDVYTISPDGSFTVTLADGTTHQDQLEVNASNNDNPWIISSVKGWLESVMYLVPAGVEGVDGFADNSDKNKDRMVLSNDFEPPLSNPDYVLYRVSKADDRTTDTKKKKEQSDKKETTESSSRFSRDKLDKGDFLGLEGTWRNGRSTIWKISADGTVNGEAQDGTTYAFKLKTASDKGNEPYFNIPVEANTSFGDDHIVYVPGGVDMTSYTGKQDESEKAKDRLVTTGGADLDLSTPMYNVWYRIDGPKTSTSQSSPKDTSKSSTDKAPTKGSSSQAKKSKVLGFLPSTGDKQEGLLVGLGTSLLALALAVFAHKTAKVKK